MNNIKITYTPPENWICIKTIEMHTGGEPLRILTEGVPAIPGNTILEKRKYFREHFDHIRTGLMFEPRGHADMYGAVITEPVTQDGDFGIFFMHNEGYSTMCGHATIAVAKLAAETKMLACKENEHIKIDAPPGRLLAKAGITDGKVTDTSFINVPSFVLYTDKTVDVPGIGMVHFDLAYGGAFYAFCDADALSLDLSSKDYYRLIDYGKRIKKAVAEQFEPKHPFEKDLSFLYGVIFTGKAHMAGHHSRNVCIFADGEVDRSPTGSGVSARAALYHAKGELGIDESITIESILGTTMDVRIVRTEKYGPHDAVVPEVTGQAYFTGRNEFWFDPDDPLIKGFIFR